MNRSHIPGFPNRMPSVDWLTYLPVFKDQKGDDAAIHLVRFHMHVRRLKIEFHEDCLMKMFMASLEDDARFWYEQLPAASISSLRDFHTVFFQHFKESYPLLLLVEDCCECFDNFIQLLERIYGDDQFMNEEIIEVLHENPFQHHTMQESSHMIVAPSIDIEEISTPESADPETSISFNSGDEPHVDVSFEAFVEDQVLNDAAGFSFDRRDEYIPRYVSKTHSSPLSEDEIEQLLNSQITTPAQISLQCSYSSGYVSPSSPIIEHVNLILDDDSREINGLQTKFSHFKQDASDLIEDRFQQGDIQQGFQKNIVSSLTVREEINQILNMQLATQSCTNVEQIDAEIFVSLQEDGGSIYDDDSLPRFQFEDTTLISVEKYESVKHNMLEMEPVTLEEFTFYAPSIFLTEHTSDLSAECICDEYSDVGDILSLEQLVEAVSEKENDLHTSLEDDLEGYSIVPLESEPEHHKLEFYVVRDGFTPKEHTFMDHFACLLEFSENLSLIVFITKGDGFRWQSDLSQIHFYFLIEGVECMLRSSFHLLDWLHWKFSIT